MSDLRANLPKYSLWFALAMLLWFVIAVFGPKIGLIGWKTGFGIMTVTAGPILMGIVAPVAIIALALAWFGKPRGPWWKAAIALAIPAVLFSALLTVKAKGDSVPPIHDVATDLRDPPAFSAQTLAMREEWGANPLVDYGTPLGQLPMWQDSVDGDLAVQNHADIIAANYDELQPIPVGNATPEQAMNAIVAAMGEIGLDDIRTDRAAGTVEGVAETFAYGFRDDVIARVRGGRIDLRSASRVGLSDLGYNAERVEKLRKALIKRLGS
ncbi:DUF1499 domain-containing protein [Erythrobacter litoralis]|uniref:DUF1499 domain-containing protein n=1 Tax=Erythrobacter litoralis TaxID=39960 RepID=UPI00243505CD|nr:DUF1499 domain-containing protein [Erythrobacter litoralis]MDG6078828.1 DUF1499 domain-containing protein [Erythrobacter litoralis]